MSKNPNVSYGLTNPLQKMNPLTIIAQRAPLPADLNYEQGQLWLHEPANKVYVLTSTFSGIANWEILGGQGMSPITEYVVAADGSADYTTIQFAINAANAAGGNAAVYVRPGTYVENLTLYSTVDIIGADGIADDATCIIRGIHTPPAAGTFTMRNIRLESATHIFNSAAAGTANLFVIDCQIVITNGYVFNLLNWTGTLVYFDVGSASTNDGVINNTGGATVFITDATIGAGAGNQMIVSGNCTLFNVHIQCPVSLQGASITTLNGGSWIDRTITVAATGSLTCSDTTFSTGATASLTQSSANSITLSNVTIISAANPCITGAGAGTLNLSNVTFTNNNALSATLTVGGLSATRCTKVLVGDSTYRISAFSGNSNLIQAYGQDETALGASTQNAIQGNLNVVLGNGGHTPNAILGSIDVVSGANVLTAFGTRGYCEQSDGSIVASTAAGAEGHLNILETNQADLPQFFAFGVKGYLDSTDAAAAPAATCRMAGVGSVVEYNTPFNGAVYGVNVSRLDQGAGAGTAGLAAYGVTQGIRGAGAIADWLYAVDLYNGATGVAYTNADIRMQNQTTIRSTTNGITISGNVNARSLNATNVNIPAFYIGGLGQEATGSGLYQPNAAAVNNIYLQEGLIMEMYNITAQTLGVPKIAASGLNIGGDATNSDGLELNFGVLANNRFAFVSQTSLAFFVEATFVVTTVANIDPLWIGFRRNNANNATFTNYTDAAFIGLYPTTAATVAIVGQNLNAAGFVYTNTTNAWANGATVKVRVNVAANGAVTYLINDVAPVVAPAAFTFDAGDVIIPCIHLVQDAGGNTPVYMTQFACGFQATT